MKHCTAARLQNLKQYKTFFRSNNKTFQLLFLFNSLKTYAMLMLCNVSRSVFAIRFIFLSVFLFFISRFYNFYFLLVAVAVSAIVVVVVAVISNEYSLTRRKLDFTFCNCFFLYKKKKKKIQYIHFQIDNCRSKKYLGQLT